MFGTAATSSASLASPSLAAAGEPQQPAATTPSQPLNHLAATGGVAGEAHAGSQDGGGGAPPPAAASLPSRPSAGLCALRRLIRPPPARLWRRPSPHPARPRPAPFPVRFPRQILARRGLSCCRRVSPAGAGPGVGADVLLGWPWGYPCGAATTSPICVHDYKDLTSGWHEVSTAAVGSLRWACGAAAMCWPSACASRTATLRFSVGGADLDQIGQMVVFVDCSPETSYGSTTAQVIEKSSGSFIS